MPGLSGSAGCAIARIRRKDEGFATDAQKYRGMRFLSTASATSRTKRSPLACLAGISWSWFFASFDIGAGDSGFRVRPQPESGFSGAKNRGIRSDRFVVSGAGFQGFRSGAPEFSQRIQRYGAGCHKRNTLNTYLILIDTGAAQADRI
jgi:hypothetical protein